MDKEEQFKFFVSDLLATYHTFCLTRFMHPPIDDEPSFKYYSKFKTTWDKILYELETSYLVGFARLFDLYDLKREERITVSVYYFLDYPFRNYEETIQKIKKFRDKVLVHSNRDYSQKQFYTTEFGFREDRSDFAGLIEETIKIFNGIKENFGYKNDIKAEAEEQKEKAEQEFTKWYEVFQEGFRNLQSK